MNAQLTNRTASIVIGNELVPAAWALVADLWAVLADDEKPTPKQQWRLAYREHRRVLKRRENAQIGISKDARGRWWATYQGASPTHLCTATTVAEAHKEMVEWLIDKGYLD